MYILEQTKRQFDIFVLFKAGVTVALSTLGKIIPDLSLTKMAE